MTELVRVVNIILVVIEDLSASARHPDQRRHSGEIAFFLVPDPCLGDTSFTIVLCRFLCRHSTMMGARHQWARWPTPWAGCRQADHCESCVRLSRVWLSSCQRPSKKPPQRSMSTPGAWSRVQAPRFLRSWACTILGLLTGTIWTTYWLSCKVGTTTAQASQLIGLCFLLCLSMLYEGVKAWRTEMLNQSPQ